MKKIIGIGLALAILSSLFIPCHAVDLNVGGKSAVLMDLTTGTVLYEKNAHEALAPASVTKVMTMLLIMEAIDDGRIGWNDTVTASEAAAAKGGSQVYLKVGETMTVTEMLKSIAVSSANDCACAMAEHLYGSEAAFVEKMNERARELGMDDTNFVNCTGLDDGPDADKHRTSAMDIALMSRQLMRNHPDIQKFTTIWMDSIRGGAFGLSNTNKLIRFYPGATGLKTGFTSGAGYCLSATAEREGLHLIAVVMGCSTTQERFSACKSMLDYGFAGFSLIDPALEGSSSVPVKLGTKNNVPVELGSTDKILIDKSQRGSVTTEVTLEESVPAPVSRGQKLGMLTVKAADRVLAEIPLIAGEEVPRLTYWQIFTRLLGQAVMSAEEETTA